MIGSDKQDQVLAAFVALQVGLTNPTTDAKARVKMKQGGEYGYSYLSLPALLDHIAKPRREAGLAIAQEVHGAADFVAITTYLIHLSGEWMSFGDTVFPAPQDPQQRGAVISYARRYSLLAALGLAAEDDDAQKVSKRGGGRGLRMGKARIPNPHNLPRRTAAAPRSPLPPPGLVRR